MNTKVLGSLATAISWIIMIAGLIFFLTGLIYFINNIDDIDRKQRLLTMITILIPGITLVSYGVIVMLLNDIRNGFSQLKTENKS
jgi:uncharacterized membrane protein YidH (DUF202 family)